MKTLGRYRIVRELGEGGMGRVYLGEAAGPSGFSRKVVIKVVRDALDATLQQMLAEEARLAAQLVHRNLVPVLDLDEADGQKLVILEYIDGIDVRRLMDARGALPWPLAVFIASEVAAGLDYAHRRRDAAGRLLGVVHRDVSPQNVLVSFEGEVKLTDFGVASLAARDQGGLRGNPAYMPPEQARGEEVDARADVFALAAVLRELLTGEPSFAETTVEAARTRRIAPLPAGTWPAALAEVIARAAAPSIEARYPSAAALRDALIALPGAPLDPARALAEHVAAARPTPALKPDALRAAVLGAGRPLTEARPPAAPTAPTSRRRTLYALATALALTVAITTGVLLSRRPPKTTLTDPIVVTASPSERAPEPEPKATPRPRGTLMVNAVPWARIFVDGRAHGQTPRELSLPAGTHQLKLVTPGGDTRTRSVTVSPNRETRLTVDFAQP
jgi:serine/threonine protein kinase